MPVFSSPLRYDWTYAEGAPRRDRRFWSYYGTQARGTTVIRTGGVWASVPNPTTDTTEAADLILFPDGQMKPAVLLGGHVTEITQTIGDELVAAGYTVIPDPMLLPAIDVFPSAMLYPGAI